jgi:DNA-binding transcriptional LysR family regulator
MTNLNELHYFLHVADSGGFTAAAQLLGIPKSTVSRGVARLEERLGMRLLERTTRRMALTEAGEVYLEYCRQALEKVQLAESVVGAMRGTPRGRLRVGAPIPFSRSCLAPLMPEFLERYPDVHLHLLLGEDESNLLESNLDLQIQTGPVDDSEMFVRYLGRVQYGIYASRSYVDSKGLPSSPDDLVAHECITFKENGPNATWALRNGSTEIDIRPQPRFSSVDSAILLQLALAGVGITIIPCWLVAPYICKGELVRLLPDWVPEPVEISAVYPSPLNLAPNARAFLEFLVERLSFD